ncbi:glycerate kinase [Rhodoferax sp.]|uniref:glycerate kinase type-2 family protein n=1 Tax=Rhodoferax sp. TaxID=50421 RepID=UPI0025F51B94|nr:glycerate kinase [Rhodoferax sp.]
MTSPVQIPSQIELQLQLYQAALAAANPLKVVPAYLPSAPSGRIVVVGLGKAAAAMAHAVELHYPKPLEGVVVVPTGASLPLNHIRCIEGSHPVPDASSIQAAEQLLQAISGLTKDDLVIALVSGGGSALCCLPTAGLLLQEKQRITRALLLKGAPIREINTVRRHLSAIKGGRLAAQAYPAKVVSLVISDIPGDDPALVASGPTLADSSTCHDALALLVHYGIEIPTELRSALEAADWESIKPEDPRLSGHTCHLVSCAWDGLAAASLLATQHKVPCHVLSDAMEGEARELALAHAAIALSVAERGHPFKPPCLILSGGEATVTVTGKGRGGRNTEFALALAIALDGHPRIHALSAGTDGLDGNAGAAGAWVAPDSLARARRRGLDPHSALCDNDSGSFFAAIEGLVLTGPTFTNINDFRAIYVEA